MSSVNVSKETSDLIKDIAGSMESNPAGSSGGKPGDRVYWDIIKCLGSDHYKAETEPIDLMKAGGMMHDKAVSDIIKYAYRNRRELRRPVERADIVKIIHYALILAALDRINPWSLIEEIYFTLIEGPTDAGAAAK